jgi:DNA modification methylase
VPNKSKNLSHTSKAVSGSACTEPSLPTTIIRLPIADLKPDPRNPRIHGDRQIERLTKSIRRFGFVWPVLIDGKHRVLAGHCRIEAAKRLGFQEVPTISIHHLSESQRRAFMIADNRLAELASWDETLLAEQLKELCDLELDFDLEATGFEVGEIDVLIEGASPVAQGDSDPADDVPESKSVAVTRPGDLWLAGSHRIYCSNSLNPESYLKLMNSCRATMIFTDPPFNVKIDGHAGGLGAIRHRNFQMACGEMTEAEFTDFLAQVFQRCAFHSIDGSLHYIFMDWRHMPELLAAGKRVYSELKCVCVWVKDNGGMGSLYRSQHELIFVFKRGREGHRNNVQLGQYGRYRTNVWTYPGLNSFSRRTDEGNLLALHPTVKPVALVADAIMDCTSRRDIVLDPFLGSGTTVISAERTGRVCYGIELDAQYVDTIVRRWQKFTGLSATNADSDRSFNEIEKEIIADGQRQ